MNAENLENNEQPNCLLFNCVNEIECIGNENETRQRLAPKGVLSVMLLNKKTTTQVSSSTIESTTTKSISTKSTEKFSTPTISQTTVRQFVLETKPQTTNENNEYRTFKKLITTSSQPEIFSKQKPENVILITDKSITSFLERQNIEIKTKKTNESAERSVFGAQFFPIWAIGLAITIGVVFGGLALALISALLCYKRQRTRMRSRNINTINTPTLHAFMPPAVAGGGTLVQLGNT